MSRLNKPLLEATKLIPPLLSSFHKGQLGRILVVGGSEDYTGAPYFSCMASALTGSDMNHILCSKDAGPIIKTYSPNLMVHPYLTEGKPQLIDSRVAPLLDRIHVIVVGPGLGRDPGMVAQAEQVIELAKERKIPVVIDADGLWVISQKLELLKDIDAVLTPNVVEFGRLVEAAGTDRSLQTQQQAESLASALKVTLLVKGEKDIITNGSATVINNARGSPRRVSGQGDTLSGTLATFLAWKQAYEKKMWHTQPISMDLTITAAYAASTLTRLSSRNAFIAHGRGMVTTDVTNAVPKSFRQIFKDGTEEEVDEGDSCTTQ